MYLLFNIISSRPKEFNLKNIQVQYTCKDIAINQINNLVYNAICVSKHFLRERLRCILYINLVMKYKKIIFYISKLLF